MLLLLMSLSNLGMTLILVLCDKLDIIPSPVFLKVLHEIGLTIFSWIFNRIHQGYHLVLEFPFREAFGKFSFFNRYKDSQIFLLLLMPILATCIFFLSGLPISSFRLNCWNFWHNVVYNIFFLFFEMCVGSVMTISFPFLVMVFSLLSLISLARNLSVLFLSSKNQLLALLTFSINLFSISLTFSHYNLILLALS